MTLRFDCKCGFTTTKAPNFDRHFKNCKALRVINSLEFQNALYAKRINSLKQELDILKKVTSRMPEADRKQNRDCQTVTLQTEDKTPQPTPSFSEIPIVAGTLVALTK